ncbi:MAG: DUF1565 domain-containing protein [Candidatus Saccharibacteria bacterium]
MNILKYTFIALLMFAAVIVSAKEYHIAINGNDTSEGSSLKPFRTINHAAQLAQPGDIITVHSGTYREWVNPARGGESDAKRIVYRAAEGEKVEIKGSEVIKGWKKEKEGIWSVSIPNSFFKDYNPYKDSIFGDWFNRMGRIHHTGEVFLNGKSLYEKETLAKVINPVANTQIKDSEGSTYTWYCESDNANTRIWANFHQQDPNKELVEISARRTVFFPEKPGLNYITIRGFHISQAATQWGAPTAEQVGMVATHWNKGWIIENNVISDSKCSGITLGKDRSTGHNVWSADIGNVNNDGNIHYIEVVFNTLRNGWNKEHVGSHIVRNNIIFNCEQTGICGSMGAAFSIIENNHIYNIYTKRQFSGAEIGGIKFHAAIDTQIKGNRIHDAGRGIWLDWMAQGTRVSGNLFYNNSMEDIFFEVDHGPFVVDNNIFLSAASIRTQSEGGAYVHNLIAGVVQMWPDPNRFTPYFLPHSTDMKALTTIMSGDDRFYNNILVGTGIGKSAPDHGLKTYNKAKLPVWISGNLYYNGALPSSKDVNFSNDSIFNPQVKIVEGENGYLQLTLNDSYKKQQRQLITTSLLGKAKIPKAAFDNPDSTPITIDTDFFGNKRSETNPSAGPFENLSGGEVKLKLW